MKSHYDETLQTFFFSINKTIYRHSRGSVKIPLRFTVILNECLRFVLFEVVPQREIKAESLCPKHLFSLRHFILSQTAITAASHPPFNEQNKFWQLTSSLSPSNTSTLICWWLGPTVPPFPNPPAFCFCFYYFSVITDDCNLLNRRHLLALTNHYTAAERTFVCCLY